MLYIVGVYEEAKSIVGLKIYDSVNNQLGMFYRKQVMNAVSRNNITVAGIKTVVNSKGKTEPKFTTRLYNVHKLDKIDSSGNPIDNKHVKIPLYTEGFKNNMKVTLVNSMGKLETVGYEELLDLKKQGEITGIMKSKTLQFHPWCEARGIIFQ